MKIRSRCSIILLVLLSLLFSNSAASVSVKVFSFNEGMDGNNLSKPRIYIQNTGTETINNFIYRYYFTAENGKTPSIDDYYTPNEQIMLVPSQSGYYVQYTVTDANLSPGGLLPHSNGNCVGLHYNDWSVWDKTNDFSDNQKSSFEENQNIAVYYNGTKIYGNEPAVIAGSVLREVWTNISGISTDNIPLNTPPQITGLQSDLDAARNFSDNYGVRLRGYITAPVTGNYTFWIASDDDSKLYLSTDDNPSNKGTPIASVSGYTAWKQWNKYPSQKSVSRYLVKESRYYIEVLHKDGLQDDNCSVGWLKPDDSGTEPTIIPSSVLTPYIPAVLPAAPANLIAMPISSQKINITWNDASNNEYGFKLEMKPEGGTFTEFTIVTSNMTSYMVTGLSPETKYYFRIRAYNNTGNSGYSNESNAITFAVPEGTVTRELWTNISGTLISDIPLSKPANSIDALSSLETQQQLFNSYGQRIRGYIIPPSSGVYYFWIASDDNSQLWLSTSNDPSAKVLIASVSGYTGWHIWDRFPTQKSAAITLNAGVRYYVEVLHKEGIGDDNLSVWWLKPGQSGAVPSEAIPSSALSPYIIPSIPNVPNGIAANPVSATQVDISWVDNSNNENGFRIERASGNGSFVEIGTAGANVTVYHDAGLSANTQYSYRIRAYNDLGNSVYSSTATAVTLDNVNRMPPIPELLSFAVYSSEKTTLKDHCVFNGGGAVGSNTAVEIFPEAVINGNAVSGGTILLKSQAVVHGNASAAGSITIEAGATISGEITENVDVSNVNIPEVSNIPAGSQDVKVNSGENWILPPGYYKTCEVLTGGTLTLSQGLYTFSSFFLQPDAHVLLDVEFSDMVDIEIEGALEFSDRSTVIFSDKGYVPFIRFYTNSVNTIRIGCDVQLNGTVIAPHGTIAMYSRAQCSGALYAKEISIEPDAVILSDMTDPELDSDGDHIANILEVVMGTDPNDPTSFHPIAIPSEPMIDNSKDVTITYDYSVFFPDYPSATAVPVTFPAGSLVRPYIPMLIYINNMPTSGNSFSESGYERIGRYIEFRSENGLNSGKSFNLQIPAARSLTSLDIKAFQSADSSWLPLPSATPANYEDGIDVTVNNEKPLAVAGKSRMNNATIYFDNGCTFSNSPQIQLQYLIDIRDNSISAQKITFKVEYTDLTTNVTDAKTVELNRNATYGGQSFYGSGKFVFVNPVQVGKLVFTVTKPGSVVTSYEQHCGTNYTIKNSQTMQILAKKTVTELLSATEPVVAVSYSRDVTFESSNFGDGRIVVDYSGTHSQPYAYEYYLKRSPWINKDGHQ